MIARNGANWIQSHIFRQDQRAGYGCSAAADSKGVYGESIEDWNCVEHYWEPRG
jgi:hypothetical protein